MAGGVDGGRDFQTSWSCRGSQAGALEGRRQQPWAAAETAISLWTTDHKGWFRLRDGARCEPLTIMAAHSRYMLGLEAVGSTSDAEAWPVFERLFHEYGLPDRLRSDNGPPFASAGVAGLTPLSVRFIKLAITLERIAPGKPQQNGRHAFI